MDYVFLGVIGLCLGSFVNALVWRIHEQAKLQGKKLSITDTQRLEKLSISKGRSMCLSCGHELAAKDLLPVVSWLSLRGRCRYCGARIPDTPVAELAVPIVFLLSYVAWPLPLSAPKWAALFAIWLGCLVLLVALALYDTRWYLLPDRMTYPLTALAIVFVGLQCILLDFNLSVIGSAGLGALIVAGLFYVLFQLSGGAWIGGGDVKVGVALGLLAGGFLEGLMVVLSASVLGLLFAIPQIVRGKAERQTKIPFGPFLIAATIIVVLTGGQLTSWYMQLLVV